VVPFDDVCYEGYTILFTNQEIRKIFVLATLNRALSSTTLAGTYKPRDAWTRKGVEEVRRVGASVTFAYSDDEAHRRPPAPQPSRGSGGSAKHNRLADEPLEGNTRKYQEPVLQPSMPEAEPSETAKPGAATTSTTTPALIIRVEDVLMRLRLDYSAILPTGVFDTDAAKNPFRALEAVRSRYPAQEYNVILNRFESSAKQLEEETVREQDALPSAARGIKSLRNGAFKLTAYSSIEESVVRSFLSRAALIADFDYVWARTSLNGDIVTRLRQGFGMNQVKPEGSILFTSRPEDVTAARSLQLKVVLVPNRREIGAAQLEAGPDAYVVTLEEVPMMLSLPAWKMTPKSSAPPPEDKARVKAAGIEIE
jgi:beta-phosphoglucomutase-like phosphatase (HAD superfamily)